MLRTFFNRTTSPAINKRLAESSDILAEAQKVAVAAAKEAGKIVLNYYETNMEVSTKQGNPRNLVTAADTEADALIRRIILKAFPDHSIVSEEDEPQKGSEYTWYVDPLDGTTNYTRHISYFCVSIALAKGKELLVGVIYNPVTSEFYTAKAGEGAFLNGRALRTSNTSDLAQSFVCMDFAYDNAERQRAAAALKRLVMSVKSIRVKGSGALASCEVASGKAEGYVRMGSTPWDYAAGALIIREAGGAVTDLDGKGWEPESRRVIAASSVKIAGQLLAKVRDAL